MSERSGWQAAGTHLMNRVHARLAGRARLQTRLVRTPEPRGTGLASRGRQLLDGRLMFAGHLVEAPGESIWNVQAPDAAFAAQVHDFRWLDDLAALGDAPARKLAQLGLWAWIARHGGGSGPGWTPEATGNRLVRWLQHAPFVLHRQPAEAAQAFAQSLGRQTLFLGRRWQTVPDGMERIEALTGLVMAAVSLDTMAHLAEPAARALGAASRAVVDDAGAVATRNPEDLLDMSTRLIWAAEALDAVGVGTDSGHRNAIRRMAPVLRALRHADGGLARFHGATRGPEGRVDLALAMSGVRQRPGRALAMGFARLAAGRTTILIDAAPPPAGAASLRAHASTLAFELTSGRRPLIVNCGAGEAFGADWGRAGRATPSHATLCLDGWSSARLGKPSRRGETLEDGPRNVPFDLGRGVDGPRFEGGHDGYVATHGLTHARILELHHDGRALSGEDLLMALEDPDKAVFDRWMSDAGPGGLPYRIRFHLHPEVAATPGDDAVFLTLRSGETWGFRHDGAAVCTVEPSVYLERGRLRPRPCNQIVLSGGAMQYATRIRWSLAKAPDTAIAIRDLAMDAAEDD